MHRVLERNGQESTPDPSALEKGRRVGGMPIRRGHENHIKLQTMENGLQEMSA